MDVGGGFFVYLCSFRSFFLLALSAACGGTVAVPCFCFGRRYALAKDRPLPLLRFGCFCRRQRLSCAVPHAWEAPLSVSPPLRASRQLSRRESQVYARGQRKLCGKTKFFQLCLTTNFAKTDAGTLASPRGGGGTALCAVTERGGSHVYGGAVMPPCGMTERAISQPPRGDSLKTPDKKEKCLLSQAFSVLWGKCGWRVKSFGQAARLTSRCGSRRGCSSASSSCRRTYPRCRTRPPSPAPAWPWRGQRSTRRYRRGGGPR